jgi:hypothetical protein
MMKLSDQVDYFLSKVAAKEKTPRKKVVRSLEKAKSEYGKLKSMLDGLEGQAAKINDNLEKTRASCNAARKEMLKLHKIIQNMDLANASDAIMYESGDVAYVVDGKEVIMDVDDTGDVKMMDRRLHRKKTREEERAAKSSKDENNAPYTGEVDDDSDEDGGNVEDDSAADDVNYVTDEDVDNLYLDLLRTASLQEKMLKMGKGWDHELLHGDAGIGSDDESVGDFEDEGSGADLGMLEAEIDALSADDEEDEADQEAEEHDEFDDVD